MGAETGSSPKKSFVKVVMGGFLGLCTGAVAVYSNAIFDRVIKPSKPVANFSVTADGLVVTCHNLATGQSGWWDFGDGSPLEPFDPNVEKVAHTYQKPGAFKVNLIVRNFLLDDNERNVTVDMSSAPSSPNLLPPKIVGMKIEPIKLDAPATYRISGEFQNTDEVVWKFGEKSEHLVAQSGPFERYITLPTSGQNAIVLTALSKSKAIPQVVVQTVNVAVAKMGFDAMLTVMDSVTKVERVNRTAIVAAPHHDQSGPTKGFSKTLSTDTNSTIVEAKFDAKTTKPVKNVKVEVAKDKKSVTVTGEWSVSADKLAAAAGGSDVSIPIMIGEERTTVLAPVRNTVGGGMNDQQQLAVKLPPMPASVGATRKIEFELGMTQSNGQRTRVGGGPLDANGVWAGNADISGKPYPVRATAAADGIVRVVFGQQEPVAASPPGPIKLTAPPKR